MVFEDAVYGEVTSDIDEGDYVLLKSDSFPTYHFACIVDDRAMKISHVVRGMEWLSSTAKHILLYKAFEWSPPEWVHLPLITRDGKKKLSKRDADAYVGYYRDELGMFPIALLNYLVRNGSGIRDFENDRLYSLEELVERFSLSLLTRRSLQLDDNSLWNYGRLSVQENSEDNLKMRIREVVKKDLNIDVENDYLEKAIKFLKANEEDFSHLGQLTRGKFRFLFSKPSDASKILEHFVREGLVERLEDLASETLTKERIEEVAKKCSKKVAEIQGLVRVAVIDDRKGPPIQELLDFFGEAECRKRLADAAHYVRSKQPAVSSSA